MGPAARRPRGAPATPRGPGRRAGLLETLSGETARARAGRGEREPAARVQGSGCQPGGSRHVAVQSARGLGSNGWEPGERGAALQPLTSSRLGPSRRHLVELSFKLARSDGAAQLARRPAPVRPAWGWRARARRLESARRPDVSGGPPWRRLPARLRTTRSGREFRPSVGVTRSLSGRGSAAGLIEPLR